MIPVIRHTEPILPHVRWTSRFAAVGNQVVAKYQKKRHHEAESGLSWVTDMERRPRLMRRPVRMGLALRLEKRAG